VPSTSFASRIGSLALHFLGDPNPKLSSKTELRYGSRGSLAIDLVKSTWFDHELGEGGGVLDFITRETGLGEPERKDWLRKFENGGAPRRHINGSAGKPSLGKVAAVYPYVDENGTTLSEAVRYDPKDFRQRRPDGNGGYVWSTKGVRQVPYRLPELLEAIANQRPLFIVEGEKDVENLRKLGLPATTNASGCGKWTRALNKFFRDADVVIIADNDPQKKHPRTGAPMFHDDGRPILPGQDHAHDIARHLARVAKRVRLLDLGKHWKDCPPKGDISDWIDAGGTVEALWQIVEQLPVGDSKDGGLEDRVALAFAAEHAADQRYIAKSSQWMRWDGACWQPEDTLAAFDEARKLCRAAGDSRAKTVAAVITLARSDRRIAATATQWDTDPMRLQTIRTTIDLRTGREHPPDRSHYITKRTSTHLAPAGTPHPLWSDFLDVVTEADEKLIGFLQRFAGYCLTGLTREHVLLFIYGPGRNGKGVFANTLAAVMGDYAITAPMEMFLLSKFDRHPTEIARLKGARAVVAQETQKGRRWDETKLKVLTSSDRLSGHFMRQDYFDFDPTHKLMITGNHKPGLASVNEAIRRRLLLTSFKTVIADPDPDFAAKLVPEHPAILRWMVDGCLEWQRDGLGVPDSIRQASDQYFANQDSLEQWLSDCVDANDTMGFTTTRVLYTSWKMWSEARGMSAGTERDFSASLEEKGFEWERRKYGRGFRGLTLYPDDRGPPAGEDGLPFGT
jgi:putative DNA primase/helicase